MNYFRRPRRCRFVFRPSFRPASTFIFSGAYLPAYNEDDALDLIALTPDGFVLRCGDAVTSVTVASGDIVTTIPVDPKTQRATFAYPRPPAVF